LKTEILGLAFYEALHLLDKGLLEVKGEEGENMSFQTLYSSTKKPNENAWVNFLVYRDFSPKQGLRSREGFGGRNRLSHL